MLGDCPGLNPGEEAAVEDPEVEDMPSLSSSKSEIREGGVGMCEERERPQQQTRRSFFLLYYAPSRQKY